MFSHKSFPTLDFISYAGSRASKHHLKNFFNKFKNVHRVCENKYFDGSRFAGKLGNFVTHPVTNLFPFVEILRNLTSLIFTCELLYLISRLPWCVRFVRNLNSPLKCVCIIREGQDSYKVHSGDLTIACFSKFF